MPQTNSKNREEYNLFRGLFSKKNRNFLKSRIIKKIPINLLRQSIIKVTYIRNMKLFVK